MLALTPVNADGKPLKRDVNDVGRIGIVDLRTPVLSSTKAALPARGGNKARALQDDGRRALWVRAEIHNGARSTPRPRTGRVCTAPWVHGRGHECRPSTSTAGGFVAENARERFSTAGGLAPNAGTARSSPLCRGCSVGSALEIGDMKRAACHKRV